LGTGVLTLGGITIQANGAGGLSNSSVAVAASTTNVIRNDLTAGSGGAYNIPTLTGDGTLTVSSTVADKWFTVNGMSGFTGTLNLAGVDAGAPMHVRLTTAGGGGDLSDVVINLNDARLSNRQGGAVGAIATFEIGELHSDANTQLRAYEGGGTAINANWQIGALNTSSDFLGTIVDNTATSISHLTKVGSGTLTLSGTKTYTGFTRVFEGTLTTTSASVLADVTDVALNTGATLNLNFAGTDVVDALFIDGVSQATGTWGAVGSAATHQHPLFSGTGLISVSSQPAPVLVGDYNADGTVDAADFVAWSKNVGAATIVNRNPTLFGTIGQADYDAWRRNFGKIGPPGAGSGGSDEGSVPEPTTAILIAMMLVAGGVWRRRS
jgi:autotransporter-associated beta strand protein